MESLYNGNYTTEAGIKQDLHQWKVNSFKFIDVNTVKMAIFLKLIYTSEAVPMNIPAAFFFFLQKLTDPKIYMKQGTKNTQIT